MNEQDVLDRLRAAIEQAGSQRAFADQHSISLQYVNDVLRKRREPGQKILDALGIERVITYHFKGETCLTAAVPDLLAALEGFLEWADKDTVLPEGSLQRRILTARAAIAKARGTKQNG